MRNTGALMWEYEKRVPAVADSHMAIRGAAIEAWHQMRKSTQSTVNWADKTAADTRKKIEEAVSEGR